VRLKKFSEQIVQCFVVGRHEISPSIYAAARLIRYAKIRLRAAWNLSADYEARARRVSNSYYPFAIG
jgi:hypothetical protein